MGLAMTLARAEALAADGICRRPGDGQVSSMRRHGPAGHAAARRSRLDEGRTGTPDRMI